MKKKEKFQNEKRDSKSPSRPRWIVEPKEARTEFRKILEEEMREAMAKDDF